MLVLILNGLIALVVVIVGGVSALLPDTPFNFADWSWGAFGDLVGFIIPVRAMFLHMAAILSAFMGYYAIRWLLRMIRQIQ